MVLRYVGQEKHRPRGFGREAVLFLASDSETANFDPVVNVESRVTFVVRTCELKVFSVIDLWFVGDVRTETRHGLRTKD